MNPSQRTIHKLSPEEQQRYREIRGRIAQELPELAARSRLADEAANEQTVSAALRRAIHQSRMTLDELGEIAGIDGTSIDEFLTGERTLRSDVFDRLAAALGFELPPAVAERATNQPANPTAMDATNGANGASLLVWAAWNNGSHHPSGAGYGLKVPVPDRDAYFERGWTSIVLEIPEGAATTEVEVNIAKASFWNDTCHELISQEIGRWLRMTGLAPWPPGKPPKFKIQVAGERRFRVIGQAQ